MSIIVRDNGGADFEQLEPGTYQAVCKGVFDIGTQKREYQGEVSYVEQVIIVFEVNKRMTIDQYKGERFNMNKWYTKSLGEKANLRKDLENWRGKTFTLDELAGFDIEKLIGINCMLSIIHNKKGKSVIGSISKKMEGQDNIVIEKPYHDIPEWIRNIKEKSKEYQYGINKKLDQSIQSLDNAVNNPLTGNPHYATDDPDEDLPF